MVMAVLTVMVVVCTVCQPVAGWVDVTEGSSVDAWKLNKDDLLERDCPTCGAGHKKIVYKRLTDPLKIDFKNLFLHQVQRPVYALALIRATY